MTQLDAVTLGETMVLLAAQSEGRLRSVTTFERLIGGAESNFAIALARLGIKVGWFSRLGADEFGDVVVGRLRSAGVDTSRVVRDSSFPTGVFFKERTPGAHESVTYYRRHSAASRMRPEDVDVGYLSTARLLHVTGITLALSPSARATAMQAIRIARRAGLLVSFDANVRSKLGSRRWWKGALLSAIGETDICFTTTEEAELITGLDSAAAASERIQSLGPSIVAVKDGPRGSAIRAGSDYFHQSASVVERVVNADGAGDAYAAGFAGGMLLGMSARESAAVASLMGASVTQSFGGTEGLPSRARLRSALRRIRAASTDDPNMLRLSAPTSDVRLE